MRVLMAAAMAVGVLAAPRANAPAMSRFFFRFNRVGRNWDKCWGRRKAEEDPVSQELPKVRMEAHPLQRGGRGGRIHDLMGNARRGLWERAINVLQELLQTEGVESVDLVLPGILRVVKKPGPYFWAEKAYSAGVPITPVVIKSLTRDMNERDWFGALKILSLAKKSGTGVDSESLGKLMRILHKDPKFPATETFLRHLGYLEPIPSSVPHPNSAIAVARHFLAKPGSSVAHPNSESLEYVDFWTFLLKSSISEKDNRAAVALYRATEESGVRLSIATRLHLLRSLKHSWQLAQEVFEDTLQKFEGNQIPGGFFSSLVTIYKSCVEGKGRKGPPIRVGKSFYNRARRVLDLMIECGVQPSAEIYRSLISFPIDPRNHWIEALNLHRHAVEINVNLTSGLYVSMLTCVSRGVAIDTDLWKASLHVFDAMEKANCSRYRDDLRVCNAAINVFARGRQLDKALSLFNNMKEFGVQPSEITYGTIIDACANVRDVDKAVLLYQDMKKSSLKPSAPCGGALIKAISRSGDFKQGIEVFKDLQREGLVNHIACRHLICTLVKEHRWSQALQFSEYVRNTTKIKFDLGTYAGLIAASANLGNMEMSLYFLDLMRFQKIKPNVVIYTSLIKVCSQNNQMYTAIKMFNDMIEKDVDIDTFAFNAILGGCARRGWADLSYRIYKSMSLSSVQPNHVTYGQLIYAQALKGKVGRAQGLFDEMISSSLQPTRTHYNGLIKTYNLASRFDEALALFETMKEKSVEPDVSTYQSLLRGKTSLLKSDSPITEPAQITQQIKSLIDSLDDRDLKFQSELEDSAKYSMEPVDSIAILEDVSYSEEDTDSFSHSLKDSIDLSEISGFSPQISSTAEGERK